MLTPLTIVSRNQGKIFGERADMEKVGRHAEAAADIVEGFTANGEMVRRASIGVRALLWLGWPGPAKGGKAEV